MNSLLRVGLTLTALAVLLPLPAFAWESHGFAPSPWAGAMPPLPPGFGPMTSPGWGQAAWGINPVTEHDWGQYGRLGPAAWGRPLPGIPGRQGSHVNPALFPGDTTQELQYYFQRSFQHGR